MFLLIKRYFKNRNFYIIIILNILMFYNLSLEKAQIMFKLARKNNWGNKYDRLEHFKRFQNLNKAIKELLNKNWILIYKKPMFTGISLNTKYKKEIIGFIEAELSHLKGIIK